VRLYEKDSAYGKVEVIKQGDIIDLYIDGILNTGINDPSYQLGFYPMLLHENPKKVMNVGFGGGYAIQAQAKFNIDKIVCLEINPYVIEGAKLLREDTEYAMEDPRLELITGDGRNYLSSVEDKFDVIFCEVGNIWISGSSPLFTEEWLMVARDHLNKEGICAQDLQFWEISPEDLRIYLNTFRRVFPFVVIAEYNTEAVVMGSAQPIGFTKEVLAQKISGPKIKAGLERAKISTAEDLIQHVVADTERVKEITRGSISVNTDDKPILEFSTPRHIGTPEKNSQDNLLMLKGELKNNQ
jgi:spermidine synthase